MNLTCNVMSLRQTPTYITYMCLPISKPPPLRGKSAKKALLRYKLWVESSLNGAWDNEGEYKRARDIVTDHLLEIHAALEQENLEIGVI